MSTLNEDALSLRDLKKRRDDANKTYKELDKEFVIAQSELMERMDAEKSEGTKVDGTNFVPAKTEYGSIQDMNEFREWAEENRPELLEAKPRGELLNEYARELLANKEPFPPGMGFRVKEYISQRAN